MLKMTFAQDVETSVTTNSPCQDSFDRDDQILSRYKQFYQSRISHYDDFKELSPRSIQFLITSVVRQVERRLPARRVNMAKHVSLYCIFLFSSYSFNFRFCVKGRTLDVFAREPLWKIGLDYRHGTGHGIGHFLNVHEGTRHEY